MKSNRSRRRHMLTGVAALTGMALLAGWGAGGRTDAEAATSAETKAGPDALQQDFVGVISEIRPEVVEISTSIGLGSGIVYDRNGDIVTNDHVVGDATTFMVSFVNGKRLSATLVGTYAADDLAVIRVQGAQDLSPATFGNSSTLQVGDIVLAIGNPLGLASSVTEGIVSYNGRTVSEPNGVTLPSTIQTSAAINPGNSGGALVDLAGQVVGIPTLAATDPEVGTSADGIGFAVPSGTVKKIVPQLIARGSVTRSDRAALGFIASGVLTPQGDPAGVVINQVAPGGPAAQAGLQPGDVITNVDGQPITSLPDLEGVLADLSPGDRVKVSYIDPAGNRLSVSVTLSQLANS